MSLGPQELPYQAKLIEWSPFSSPNSACAVEFLLAFWITGPWSPLFCRRRRVDPYGSPRRVGPRRHLCRCRRLDHGVDPHARAGGRTVAAVAAGIQGPLVSATACINSSPHSGITAWLPCSLGHYKHTSEATVQPRKQQTLSATPPTSMKYLVCMRMHTCVRRSPLHTNCQ